MLGIAYSITECTDNLMLSLAALRPHADYIVFVYQTITNHGNKLPEEVYNNLEVFGADEVIRYVPKQFEQPARNEVEKRNLGLQACIDAGCTHFLSLTPDELFLPDSFAYAKQQVMENGWHSSACMQVKYYKYTDVALDYTQGYTPFIYRIDKRRFAPSLRWPVQADPLRKMLPGKLLLFNRQQIQLHNLKHVKPGEKQYREMLDNSTNRINFFEHIPRLVNTWLDFDRSSQYALIQGAPPQYSTVKQVEDIETLVQQQLAQLSPPTQLLTEYQF